MSSLFNGFGLSSAGPKALDPAAEISRLLNQHSHHWQTLEKEIAAVRSKKTAAEQALAAAVQAKEEARAAAIAADREVVRLEADGEQCRAELQSSRAANSKLLESVEGLKQELAGINSVADQARKAFQDEVAALMAALKKLKEEHPDAFFTNVSAWGL